MKSFVKRFQLNPLIVNRCLGRIKEKGDMGGEEGIAPEEEENNPKG
jgi:hypothetical protein